MLHSSLVVLPLVALLAFTNAAPVFHVHHFHAGQKLVATFTPSNDSAQLAFAFCVDVESTKCHVVNLIGHKDGNLAAYFFRKGEALSAAADAGEHAHHDHSHEGHTHSEHHAAHAAHAAHAQHQEAASPAEEIGSELEKALREMQKVAEELSVAANSTVVTLGGLAYAWMPPNDIPLENDVEPIDFVYSSDNLNVWNPLKAYQVTILKNDGKVNVRLEGGNPDNAARLSWPLDDRYMHTTAAVRFNLGTVTVNGPVAA